MDVFIATTSTTGLTPLGPPGQRSHILITDVLRDHLERDHARLFADPVAGALSGRVDWYTDGEGAPIPFARLTRDEQNALREALGRYSTDIAALAKNLKDARDPHDVQLGQSLEQALEIPGEDSIFALRDGPEGDLRPVLINWGWVRSAEHQVRGVLSGYARTARVARTAPETARVLSAAAPLPAPVAQGWAIWPWLLIVGWLLLAVLLASILWLLIRPCALTPNRFANFCPVPTEVTASDLSAERLVLENQIAAIERELTVADNACQPVAPPQPLAPPPPVPEPEAPPNDALDQRLQERGGRTGDLNFTLFWNNKEDLDIYVTCPSNDTVYYNKRTACGGTLDIDANRDIASAQNSAVENIFFINPIPGQYSIKVHLFSKRTGRITNFTIRILQRGTHQDFTGSVSGSNRTWHKTITVTE